jgi:hypothetical protein
MPKDDPFKSELAELLSKHGVAGLGSEMTRGPQVASPGGLAASYIKEIITDSQAFDEKVLDRVVSVLRTK